MPTMTAQVAVETLQAIQDATVLVDGGHNLFVAVQRSNGTGADIWRFPADLTPGSIILTVVPPSGYGISGVSMGDDGNNVWVVIDGHKFVEGVRPNYISKPVILTGVFVPRDGSGGVTPVPGGFPPPPPPTGDDVDYNKVGDTVVAKFAAALATADSPLNKAFINSERVGIQREQVLTEGTVYNSPGLYARIRDAVYEQLRKFFPGAGA